MADAKISALPSATVPLAGTEVLPIVQSSTTDKVTAADLLRQNGQTVTTSNPVLSLAQTWNAGGVTFTGMLFNATDTASASGSLLLDLQAGGSSRFSVTKAGAVTTANSISYISGSYNTQIVQGGFFSTVPNGASAYVRLSQTGIVDFSIVNTASTGVIAHSGATTHEFRNGTTAQASRVYKTYTDASNYERIEIGGSLSGLGAATYGVVSRAAGTGVTTNIMYVGTMNAGTLGLVTDGNTRWTVGTTGHLIAAADNAVDIGASGANRPRSLFLGTNLTVGGQIFGASGTFMIFGSNGRIGASGNGTFVLYNDATTDFGRLQFGGATSSFPALKRSTTSLEVKLADDSAYGAFQAAAITANAGTAIPAGGTTGAGLKVSTTSNFGVFFGSGAPTLSAAKGSLYLRSDGTTTNDRMYVNTDGSTTWTAVTTAA